LSGCAARERYREMSEAKSFWEEVMGNVRYRLMHDVLVGALVGFVVGVVYQAISDFIYYEKLLRIRP
jgi:hypothetical protein